MPTKEDSRRYMASRQSAHEPPPSQEEIRRQIGWALIEAQRGKEFPIRIEPGTNRN